MFIIIIKYSFLALLSYFLISEHATFFFRKHALPDGSRRWQCISITLSAFRVHLNLTQWSREHRTGGSRWESTSSTAGTAIVNRMAIALSFPVHLVQSPECRNRFDDRRTNFQFTEGDEKPLYSTWTSFLSLGKVFSGTLSKNEVDGFQ